MPMTLQGSCRCGAVRFSLQSHTPVPYQLCYCTICRKTGGGGGYAINLGGLAATMEVQGETAVYRAEVERNGACEVSTGERNFCAACGSELWLYDPTWPDLIHPMASAIDTPLPPAPARVHLMLADKPEWVPLEARPEDECYDAYPALSLEDWHKKHGLWAA
ncbi:GFA family protein [Vannielia litorea]|uniref:GFA family protein n=1 Tax=Vannielia litorea TaxID=1217970 RepID=UPI001BCCEE9A|nr:GFA family protein [Vannielia litorea]MBS8225861.1 GFA family protein [Vannielia litorea]